MSLVQPSTDQALRLKRALGLWGVYFITTLLVNGSLLYLLGVDLHAWSYSPLKDLLVNLSIYGVLFLVAPLVLTVGWETVRQPGFLLPLIIGLMYTAHEMSNPEYWYEGMQFGLVLVGVFLFTLIYLWRRSVVVFWLGDGLGRFLSRLLFWVV